MTEPAATRLPEQIHALIGKAQYPETATFRSSGATRTTPCQPPKMAILSTGDTEVANQLKDGMTMPVSTLSLWMRPHRWEPGAAQGAGSTKNSLRPQSTTRSARSNHERQHLILHEPVRPGDVISHHQVQRSISDIKTTKLGTGRFWVIDVEYHNQDGELVGIESYTGFGYKRSNEVN